jgi:WD40 repeat protein
MMLLALLRYQVPSRSMLVMQYPQQKFPSSGSSTATIVSPSTPSISHIPATSQWHCLKSMAGHSGLFASITSLAINQHNLATASEDKTIRIWEHDQLITTLVSHTLAFSSDGQQLASGSGDRTIKLWSMSTGKLITTLIGHKMKVNAVAFHEAAMLASGGADRLIRLWDTQTWQCQKILPGHAWQISSLAFIANSEVLLSSSWDKTVKFWQISSGQEFDMLFFYSPSRQRPISFWSSAICRCSRSTSFSFSEVASFLTSTEVRP